MTWNLNSIADAVCIAERGSITAKVVAIYNKKAFLKTTEEIPEDTTFGLILDRTSFYAESGGQEYDTGSIVIDGVAEFEVTNVQVFNGYVLHIGNMKYGKLSVGDEIVSSYDEVRLIDCEGWYKCLLSMNIAPSLAPSQQPHRNPHSQLLPPRRSR